MRKKILETIKRAQALADCGEASKRELKRLEKRAAYFQNERLVHLITTAFVGLAAMISLVVFAILGGYFAFALLCALVLLFGAYIAHYYALENGVQKLNDLLDKLRE